MTYTIEMMIHEERSRVAQLYLDMKHMPEWEKGLESIETTQGTLFETGSQGIMHFTFDKTSIKMNMTIEKACLPELIIQIFEVPGAWNRCVNHFIAIDDQTKWVMEVIFEFSQTMDLPKERFIEKTTESMTMFKRFVEGIRP
jgi:hypothetical protein